MENFLLTIEVDGKIQDPAVVGVSISFSCCINWVILVPGLLHSWSLGLSFLESSVIKAGPYHVPKISYFVCMYSLFLLF